MRLLTLPAAAAAVLLFAGMASAQSTDLEKRVKDLEMKMADREASPEAGGTTEGKSMVEAYFDDGLRLKAGKDFEGRIGAYVIAHGTFFIKENERDSIDTISIREAGVEVYGRLWEAWEVFVSPRIMPGGTVLYYGWAEFNKWEVLKLRAGLFKEPYSLEVAEHTKWMDMPENSLMSLHDPNRDLGAMIHGEVAGGILNYSVGLFNGNGAGGADENSDKDVAARVVLRPGAKMDNDILKHLYIGGAVTHGRARRDLNVEPFSFEVPATKTTFHQAGTAADFRVDDDITRGLGTLAWCWGPLELKTEWSYYRAKIEWNDDVDTWNSYANYTSLGFWIGGSRTPGKRPVVDKPLFGEKGGFGAIQIVARYSKIYLGSEFQDETGAAGTNHVREYAGAINWYPNEHARFSVMYSNIEYGSEEVVLAGGTMVDDENVWIIRFQIDF